MVCVCVCLFWLRFLLARFPALAYVQTPQNMLPHPASNHAVLSRGRSVGKERRKIGISCQYLLTADMNTHLALWHFPPEQMGFMDTTLSYTLQFFLDRAGEARCLARWGGWVGCEGQTTELSVESVLVVLNSLYSSHVKRSRPSDNRAPVASRSQPL